MDAKTQARLRARQQLLAAVHKQGIAQGWSAERRKAERDRILNGGGDDGYSVTPEMIAEGKQYEAFLRGGSYGSSYGRRGGGYYRGGGGGGGVDIAKLKKQLADLKTQARGGVDQVGNETVLRLQALQNQAKERNSALLGQIGNPYANAMGQANSIWGGMTDDARRWGAPTAALSSEIDARRLAMNDSEARQRSLMGQIGSQMEASLAGRQASAEQARQNALNDLEKLYTAAMQKLGG